MPPHPRHPTPPRPRPFLRALTLALTVILFLLFAQHIAKPQHAAGTNQSLWTPINRIAHLTAAPGGYVAIMVNAVSFRHRTSAAQTIALAGNFAFYFIVVLAALTLQRARHTSDTTSPTLTPLLLPAPYTPTDSPSPAPVTPPSSPTTASSTLTITPPSPATSTPATPSSPPTPTAPRLTRRAFLTTVLPATAAATLATKAIFHEPSNLTVTRRRFPLQNLPPELANLRIVHLTDLHHGPWITLDYLHRVIQTANSLNPDLVFLTGDFVSSDPRYIAPLGQVLARLKPRLGTLATLGNHDHWTNPGQVRDMLLRAGARLLDNTRLFLPADHHQGLQPNAPRDARGLCLAGVGDLWEDEVDFHGALQPAPPDMPRLVLSHNPDTAEQPELLRPRANTRIDLLLCGHTHGGQVSLPLIGSPIIPSRYGQKYARGLVQSPTCPVLINRGIGMTVLPIRLGSAPEVSLIELTCQS